MVVNDSQWNDAANQIWHVLYCFSFYIWWVLNIHNTALFTMMTNIIFSIIIIIVISSIIIINERNWRDI